VRRAIVTALGSRSEPQRIAPLELAAKLDPDDTVRESARLALLGRLPLPFGRFGAGCAGTATALGGCYVAWMTLVASSADSVKELGERPSGWLDPSGLMLPLVADPDGSLVVAGVSAGRATFRLASSSRWYDDPEHGPLDFEAIR
jgi:cellulose synthase operon protein C